MNRTEILLRDLDPSRHQGIELGPWYAPVAPKADGWRTCVVDVFGSDELRERANTHTEGAIRDLAHRIEDVDVVWSGQPFGEVPALTERAPFDFILASHAIEHVPDIIRFIQGMNAVLGENGVVSLAVPDSRFCFDALRPQSTSADALVAYREARTLHTPETFFSNIAYGVHLDGQGAWAKGSSGSAELMSGMEWAQQQYLEYLASWSSDEPRYRDCHAWVFTPSSFELLILDLRALDLIDLDVQWTDRSTLGSEFFVRLHRSEQRPDPTALAQRRLALMLDARREMAQTPLSAGPAILRP